MAILELLAQPHISMPYVHMGLIATLYDVANGEEVFRKWETFTDVKHKQ
jgi:hypothetical protein